ncbi:hypothetical protein ACFVYR_05850 [Streptomyces sp. NPDC058284]|uniref:hypothetical protein n=1 Tax=unclassified Streptomyces TaxID=2593676 RepID=UPI003651CB3B
MGRHAAGPACPRGAPDGRGVRLRRTARHAPEPVLRRRTGPRGAGFRAGRPAPRRPDTRRGQAGRPGPAGAAAAGAGAAGGGGTGGGRCWSWGWVRLLSFRLFDLACLFGLACPFGLVRPFAPGFPGDADGSDGWCGVGCGCCGFGRCAWGVGCGCRVGWFGLSGCVGCPGCWYVIIGWFGLPGCVGYPLCWYGLFGSAGSLGCVDCVGFFCLSEASGCVGCPVRLGCVGCPGSVRFGVPVGVCCRVPRTIRLGRPRFLRSFGVPGGIAGRVRCSGRLDFSDSPGSSGSLGSSSPFGLGVPDSVRPRFSGSARLGVPARFNWPVRPGLPGPLGPGVPGCIR